MARLPTFESFGQRPNPRAPRNVIPFSAGAGQRAEAAGFRGISAAAGQLGDIAENFIQGEQRQQLVKARSDFLTGKVELDGQFAEDKDFKTAEARYTEAIGKLREKSSEGLFGQFLGAFDNQTSVDIARGVEAQRAVVFAKRKDHNLAQLAGSLDSNRQAVLTARDADTRRGLLATSREAITAMVEQGFLSEVQGQRLARETAVDFAVSRVSMQPPGEQLRLLGVPENQSPDVTLPARENDGSIVDFIPEDTRTDLARRALADLKRQDASERSRVKSDARIALAFARDTGEDAGDVEQRMIDLGLMEEAAAFARQRDGNIEVHDTIEGLAFASPREINDQLLAVKPEEPANPTTDEAREFLIQKAIFEDVVKGVIANRKALDADPAGYVSRDPDVADAFKASQEAPRDAGLAQTAADVSLAAQDRLGVPEGSQRVLTVSQARAQVIQLNDPEVGARGQARILAGLGQQYGRLFPIVYRDLVKEGFPAGRQILAAIGDSVLAGALVKALDEGNKVLIEALGRDGPEIAKDIKDAVRTDLGEYIQSVLRADMSGLGGATAFTENIVKSITSLALSLAARGADTNSAAETAANVILARYEFQDGYRVPIQFDPDQVALAVDAVLSEPENLDLAPPLSSNSDLTVESLKATMVRAVENAGFFVTNEDESGLVLMVETNQGAEIVRDTGGDRVEIKFAGVAPAAAEQKQDRKKEDAARLKVPGEMRDATKAAFDAMLQRVTGEKP